MKRLKIFINRFLHLFEVRRINSHQKIVYLTFDDGPEFGITEFVLGELKKHEFKATFFCRGDNAEKNPSLLRQIVEEGHALGNHTYSHINSFDTPSSQYLADVKRADTILHTHLFRPPWGSITLTSFLRLYFKYRIVYWNVMSGDTALEQFDKSRALKNITSKTQAGDVVLFHFCQRHERETRQLLPAYLSWLEENGYKSETLH